MEGNEDVSKRRTFNYLWSNLTTVGEAYIENAGEIKESR